MKEIVPLFKNKKTGNPINAAASSCWATLVFSVLLLQQVLPETLQMLFFKHLENKRSAAFGELKLSGVGEAGPGSRAGCV